MESPSSSTEELDYKPLSYDFETQLRVANARSRYSNRTVTLLEHSVYSYTCMHAYSSYYLQVISSLCNNNGIDLFDSASLCSCRKKQRKRCDIYMHKYWNSFI